MRWASGHCWVCIASTVLLGTASLALAAESKPIAPELVTAIRNGDERALQKLVASANVNSQDEDGNTPLILAAMYAGGDCVEALLNKGADSNIANQAGATALHRAASSLEKTRMLLAAGAKANVRSKLGNTPLLLAARCAGNTKTVALFLENGADAKSGNGIGVTPILAAAASGDVESVRLLLDNGADPNDFPTLKGPLDGLAAGFRTPLMWAAYHNSIPMIRLLIDKGADPNKVIVFGTPLTSAAWHDSLEAAELLIERGTTVNTKDPFSGFTPLHWAAASEASSPKLVKLLLDKGSDPNATGGEHIGAFALVPQTPRLIAERRGRTAIVEALIAAGAKNPPAAEKITESRRTLPDVIDNPLLISSAQGAVDALQTTASKSRDSFLQHVSHQDCTSCHQQYLPMAAVGNARSHSVRIDDKMAKGQIELLANSKHPFFNLEFIAQTLFHPEPVGSFGYELLGLLAEKVPASPATDARVHHLVSIQTANGSWIGNLPRPPIQSNDVSTTALAILAIKQYGWAGRRAEFDASVDRGRQWLWKLNAETGEEGTFQLLGLSWAGESPEKLGGLAATLIQKQRKDGGWSQLPMLDSDAYATGQVLFALSQAARIPVTDPAWQKGLRFLLTTQQQDGTWRVARRAFPFQPTMNSGFPYYRDAWVSAAATSWAVMAMTPALPVGAASDTVAAAPQITPANQPVAQQKVDFASQIKPILERSCLGCHGPQMPRGYLRVDDRTTLLRGGESGAPAIVPGHSEKSQLLDFVSDRVPESEMPPKAARGKFPPLTKDELGWLRAWIDQGAEWPKEIKLTPLKSKP